MFLGPPSRIDHKIEETIGRSHKKQLTIHTLELPGFRFVDLFDAVEHFVAGRPGTQKVESQQQETLNQLVHDKASQWTDRSIGKSSLIVWQIAVDKEKYLPLDCFWLCPSKTSAECFVIRQQFDEFRQVTKLELACAAPGAGETALDVITGRSKIHSIYRNQNLHLSYEASKKDDYGDIEKPERFQVMFSAVEPVTDADIVLTNEHLQVLQRNVVDLFGRREILKANGVPARRGILLHGPPGTGKTYACRYLCHHLNNVTKIFVTGSSLTNVGAIFSLARLLQPAVLFLEDVDLIFASREINLYSTALGDLLDQMDGLRSQEEICVVLTTNAIDRLEAAIKDRPGRISQCIYMGPPNPKLRRRYIEHYLRPHRSDQLNLDSLVDETEGATQAFLKEWIHRAVQVACERLEDAKQKAELENTDFAVALDEMRRFLEGSDGQIIGFSGRGNG